MLSLTSNVYYADMIEETTSLPDEIEWPNKTSVILVNFIHEFDRDFLNIKPKVSWSDFRLIKIQPN